MATTTRNPGMPLTNAEIAAQKKATEARYGTKDGAPPIPPVLQSYTYGRYQLVWTADRKAEVRIEGNTVAHAGTYDECLAWIKARV